MKLKTLEMHVSQMKFFAFSDSVKLSSCLAKYSTIHIWWTTSVPRCEIENDDNFIHYLQPGQ